MWIQILLLLGIAGTVLPLTRGAAGARHQAIRRLMLVGFVVIAAFAVLFPNLLSRLANVVGVGRGTDLLLYLLVIAFLSYVATSYRRLGVFDHRVTVLTRKLALAEAHIKAQELAVSPGGATTDEGSLETSVSRPPASESPQPGAVPTRADQPNPKV